MNAEQKVKQVYPKAWYGRRSRAVYTDDTPQRRVLGVSCWEFRAWQYAWSNVQAEQRNSGKKEE